MMTSLFIQEDSIRNESSSVLPRIVEKYRKNLVNPLNNPPKSVSNKSIIQNGINQPIDTDQGNGLLHSLDNLDL